MDFAPLLELFPNLPPSLVQTTLHLHAGDVDAAVAELLQAGPPSRKRRRRDDPVATLAAMGFTAEEAQTALHNCGSLEAAVAVLLGGEPGVAGGAQGEAEVMDVDMAEARPPLHDQLLAAPPASRSGKRKQARAAQGTAQATPQPNGLPSTGISSAAASSAASSSSSSSSSMPQPRPRLPSEEQLLLAAQRYSDAVAELAKDPTKPKAAPCRIAPEDQTVLVAVYDEMIDRFNCREYHQKYGYHPSENVFLSIQAGQPVPPYFANVQHGSIFSRKLLSMQGLRNLILHGPTIFQELRGQLFASDPTKYPANTGLHKMRYYTGNTVDLDTVVLRCNDPAALKLINELNRADGRPEHGSPQEFAQSQQAIEIAVETAKQLVAGFIDDFKLTKPQQKQRRVEPAQIHPSKIPIAQDNSSRGRWPLWRYINAGVDTFHANVPSMAEVTGALLKAPAAAARAYLLCRDDPERLRAFYEDGISDSCFNGKWKALEAFNDMLDKRGSINVILADLQAANQHIFTAAFFAADDDQARNEVREMVRLVGQRTGRDKEGRVRPITPDDVQRWVQDPGQPV